MILSIVQSRSLEANQTKIEKNENCSLGFIESVYKVQHTQKTRKEYNNILVGHY